MKKIIKIDPSYSPEKDWEELKDWLLSIGVLHNGGFYEKRGSLIIEWVEE